MTPTEYAEYLKGHYCYGTLRKTFTLRMIQSQIDAHNDSEVKIKPEKGLDFLLETKSIINEWI